MMALPAKPPHVKPNFEWICPLSNKPTREAVRHDKRFWVGLLKGIADQHTSQKFKTGLMEALAVAVMAENPAGAPFDGALTLEDLAQASEAMVAVAKNGSDASPAVFYAFVIRDLEFHVPPDLDDEDAPTTVIQAAMRLRWRVKRRIDRLRIGRTDPRFRSVRSLGNYDE